MPGFRPTIIAVAVATITTAAAAQPPLAEIDAFWATVDRAVAEGDFDAYAACCHPDGVLVSEPRGLSQPFAAAFERWRPEFADTRAGRMTAKVETRFTRRLGDATTVHETGIFRYTAEKPGEPPRVDHVPFEALLVKRDGRWLMLMEYQKAAVTAAEWDALAPQPSTVCSLRVYASPAARGPARVEPGRGTLRNAGRHAFRPPRVDTQ